MFNFASRRRGKAKILTAGILWVFRVPPRRDEPEVPPVAGGKRGRFETASTGCVFAKPILGGVLVGGEVYTFSRILPLTYSTPSITRLKSAGTRKMVKNVDTKSPPTTTLPNPR